MLLCMMFDVGKGQVLEELFMLPVEVVRQSQVSS